MREAWLGIGARVRDARSALDILVTTHDVHQLDTAVVKNRNGFRRKVHVFYMPASGGELKQELTLSSVVLNDLQLHRHDAPLGRAP